MQTVIKTYIRDKSAKNPRTPRGIAVAVREGDTVKFGFSLLNTKLDRWDKNLGLKIALERAKAPVFALPSVPDRESMVLDAFERIETRALNYFKDVDPANIRIHLNLGQDQVVS